MKKLCITMLLLAGIATASSAQGVLQKAKTSTQTGTSALSNVTSTAQAILGKLGPALALTDTQKPSVLNAVTGFLKDKSGIAGLANTDKAGYASKLGGLQSGLLSKLKTVLTVAQYTKFLGLKPKTNDATNVLSQLFF